MDSELVRILVLIVTAPWWWRLAKMLWRDFNMALIEEGGLLGSPPPPSKLEEIRRQKALEPDLLVSEPWARAEDRHKPRLRTPSPVRPGGAAARPGGPPSTRKFR